jgi:hypothetical protein
MSMPGAPGHLPSIYDSYDSSTHTLPSQPGDAGETNFDLHVEILIRGPQRRRSPCGRADYLERLSKRNRGWINGGITKELVSRAALILPGHVTASVYLIEYGMTSVSEPGSALALHGTSCTSRRCHRGKVHCAGNSPELETSAYQGRGIQAQSAGA